MLANIPTLINVKDNESLINLVIEEEVWGWFIKEPRQGSWSRWILYSLLYKILAHNQEGHAQNDSICTKVCKIGGNTDSSFLALIPKEINPTSFVRLYHISLCNVYYKIISKIISNHVNPLLPNLISSN